MADYKISLGVILETDDVQRIKTQINKLETDPIKIKLDTSHVQNQINTIKTQLQSLSNIRINLGAGAGGGRTQGVHKIVDEVNQTYNDLMNLTRRINSIRLQIGGLDASKNSAQIAELSGQLNRLMTDYNNLYNTFSRSFSTNQLDSLNRAFETATGKISSLNAKMADTSAIQRQTQAFKELSAVSKEIGNLELNIAKLKAQGGNSAQIEVLEQQLRELQATYQHLVTTMDTPLTNSQWSTIYAQIAQTQDKLAQLDAKVADTKAKLASNIKANFGSYEAQIVSLEGKFDKLATKPKEVKLKLDALKQALTTLKTADTTDAIIAANQNYLSLLKQVNAQINLNTETERQANSVVALQQQRQNALLQLRGLFESNSEAAKIFGTRVQELETRIRSCGTAAGFRQINKDIGMLKTEIKQANVETKTFGSQLKKQFTKYSSYFSVASLFMYTIQGLRSMFEQVKLIDSAMTELKKVTNETDEAYSNFLKNAATRSREIGTTIDGLVSSTADFARLGYGFEDAQGLAEVANIYAVVGDEIEGVEGATESLISTMAAFKDEMNGMSNTDFAMSIIDKFNEIGNNFAISSGGIGEALERSASSLMAANNTLDESIALITAANTVVQDPEQVGTAFKTKILNCLYAQKCA